MKSSQRINEIKNNQSFREEWSYGKDIEFLLKEVEFYRSTLENIRNATEEIQLIAEKALER